MSRETEWVAATKEFLTNTPEGRNWAGSPNARELMGYLLRTYGLDAAEDKVGALQAVAAEMRERGLDVVPEKKMEVAANDSPADILLKWKSAYSDDPVKVGEAFRAFFK